jgi:hypothetical protein
MTEYLRQGRIPFDLLPEIDGNIFVVTCGDGTVNPSVTPTVSSSMGASWAYTHTLPGGTKAFSDPDDGVIKPEEIVRHTFQIMQNIERLRMDYAADGDRDPGEEQFGAVVDVQHAYCAAHRLHLHPLPLAQQFRILRKSQNDALTPIKETLKDLDIPIVQLIYNPRTNRWLLGA